MTPREVIAGCLEGPLAQDERLSMADQIIRDLTAAGYWIAPTEPTEEMRRTGALTWGYTEDIYRAMRDQWIAENVK